MEKTTEKNQEEKEEIMEMLNEVMEEADRIISEEWSVEKEAENTVSIVHKWFQRDDERQQMINYAYKLGGIDFVTMIECENWNWSLTAKWDGWHALWLCQMNDRWHKVPEWYTTDWRVAVEYCYQKWSTHTKFYGPSRIIKWKKCANYVLDRFEINDAG